jgi:acyl-CoA reductase-like NAD-dependent aldehyde dehydrogenase
VASRINSGTVWVNKHLDVGLDIPFAGAKQSGVGAESGQEGLKQFTPATIINIAKPPTSSATSASRRGSSERSRELIKS